MTAPAAEFLTPRGEMLTLRAANDPQRERTALRGEPLLVTERLAAGFVEVDIDDEQWLALDSALEPWRGAGMAAGAPAPLAVAGMPPLPPSPERASAITNPPGNLAPAVPVPARRGRPPWWMLAGLALLGLVLAGVLVLATGWWKTTTGWVVCEGGGRIEEWEVQDGKVYVLCEGLRPPRRWFRENGRALPVDDSGPVTAAVLSARPDGRTAARVRWSLPPGAKMQG